MSGSAGIRNEAFAAWDGVGRTSVVCAVQPRFNSRIPLAKLYTDVLAQESNGIGSPARLEESGSPRRVDPDRTGNGTARCELERPS